MSVVSSELGISWQEAGLVVVAALAIYGVTLVGARVLGQRQFASLSTHDLVFVFADGQLLSDQLRRARLAPFELRQLLRQQGHGAYEGLRAVVLEPTGGLSVVPSGAPVSAEFLIEVAGADLLEVD